MHLWGEGRRCPGCMHTPSVRSGFFGAIDKQINRTLQLYTQARNSVPTEYEMQVLQAAAEVARAFQSKVPPCITFRNPETSALLCAELEEPFLQRLVQDPTIIWELVEQLKLCDECHPFDAEKFQGQRHYIDIRAPGCDCTGSHCKLGESRYVRYYPNGDVTEHGDFNRSSSCRKIVVATWKMAHRALIADFLNYLVPLHTAFSLGLSLDEAKSTVLSKLDMMEGYGPGPEELPAHRTTLRFKVDDEVLCAHSGGKWMAGKVVRLWYREREWAYDRFEPYQVKLTDEADGRNLIYVPEDNDKYCRVLNGDESAITLGCTVALKNLKNVALNGRVGIAIAGESEEEEQDLLQKSRIKVRLPDRNLSVQGKNLCRMSPVPSPALKDVLEQVLRNFVLTREELMRIVQDPLKCSRCCLKSKSKFCLRFLDPFGMQCVECVVLSVVDINADLWSLSLLDLSAQQIEQYIAEAYAERKAVLHELVNTVQ